MDSTVNARKIEALRKLCNQPIVLPDIESTRKVDIAADSFAFFLYRLNHKIFFEKKEKIVLPEE